MIYHCDLKKTVDDSYEIEIGRNLTNVLINDIKNGLSGNVRKFAL